jgi:hypothetical protein
VRRSAQPVKPSSHLTLKDKLSRLTIVQAQKLLGPRGAHWLGQGGKFDIDVTTQVQLTDDSCQVAFPRADGERDPLVVLAVTLPGMQSLDALASVLAKLMAVREGGSGAG